MKTFILVLIFWIANFSGSEQISVRMIGADSQPIIKGKLNGKNAYFLVDSGSDATILNFRDVKKYGINYAKIYSDRYRFSGLNSEQSGEFLIANNMDMYLNGKKMEGCYWLLDLSKIVRSISSDTGIRINGIIGSDMMRKYDFVIDYETEKVYFTSE
ncbi:MAG: aspartyl protease family protein [Cytophagales bacterium]|nr:aspartyl protease family protein [Cytophagales bacterium]